jgi:hypothetical protein
MLQAHHLQPTLLVYKTMQHLSTVILKFLFCVTVHRAIDAAPFACELVKQNAPDFSEAFHHSERGIRTLDTAGMNRML